MRPAAFPAGVQGSSGNEGSPEGRHHGAIALGHYRVKKPKPDQQISILFTFFTTRNNLGQHNSLLEPRAEPDAAATWTGPSPFSLKRHPRPLLSLKALRCLIRYHGQPLYIPRQHPAQPSSIARFLISPIKNMHHDATAIDR